MLIASQKSLGDAIRAARKQADWSQHELARRSGLTRQSLVALEQGRGNPTWDTILRLTDVLRLRLHMDAGEPPDSAKAPLASRRRVGEIRATKTTTMGERVDRPAVSAKVHPVPPAQPPLDLVQFLANHRDPQ